MAGRQIQGNSGRRHRLLTPHDLAGIISGQGGSNVGGVSSVNGKVGNVTLIPSDIGAATSSQGVKADSAIQSVVAGTNIVVNNTDPQNPVISVGAGSGTIARWWRIRIDSRSGSDAFVTILEMQMRAIHAGTNLCTGGAAFASSIFGAGYTADKAFDGNITATSPNDCWASAATPTPALPQWLAYQLPTASAVNEIVLWARNGTTDSPSNFMVQSSNNSTNGGDGTWTDEWGIPGQVGWASGEMRTFTRP